MMNPWLWVKRILFPGTDLVIRKRGAVVRKYLLPCQKTLDAGCGNGYFSFLAQQRENQVLGIDLDAEKINRCIAFRDFIGIPPGKVRFSVWNLYDLDKLDESFDQIICLETLEHISDAQRVLRLLYEKLRPNGRLYLGVPNINSPHFYGKTVSPSEDGGHVRQGYSYEQLNEMFHEVGFSTVTRDSYGGTGTRWAVFLERRIRDRLALQGVTSDIVSALLFMLFFPLTWLDSIIRGEPMSIFVAGERV